MTPVTAVADRDSGGTLCLESRHDRATSASRWNPRLGRCARRWDDSAGVLLPSGLSATVRRPEETERAHKLKTKEPCSDTNGVGPCLLAEWAVRHTVGLHIAAWQGRRAVDKEDAAGSLGMSKGEHMSEGVDVLPEEDTLSRDDTLSGEDMLLVESMLSGKGPQGGRTACS